MDPFTPVAGVSLERYAALSAEVAVARGDGPRIATILGNDGISAADWEQAQAGWAARLSNPAMGLSIAVRFEALHHEALDRLLGPAPDVPPDDFAAMWSEALAVGLLAMWQARRLDPISWSRISHRARTALAAEPARLAASLAMAQLAAERRIAGPAAPAAAAQPGAKPTGQTFDQDASVAAKAVGKAALSGFAAFGAAVEGLGRQVLGPNVGAAVLVQWSDGKKYPGTVAKVGKDQLLVTMADGSQHWVPDGFVKAI
jgi:hypothetical protein